MACAREFTINSLKWKAVRATLEKSRGYDMSKFWRIILYFEAAGVGLAVALYFLWAGASPGMSRSLHEDQMIGVLSILCPGSWIFMMCIDCEMGTNPGVAWLLIVVGINLGVYAVLGAIAAALLTPTTSHKG
jgi:hypothetical protein